MARAGGRQDWIALPAARNDGGGEGGLCLPQRIRAAKSSALTGLRAGGRPCGGFAADPITMFNFFLGKFDALV